MLEFRNISTNGYKIAFDTHHGQPGYIKLAAGEVMLIQEEYVKKWDNRVKETVAAHVGKGTLQVYDLVGAVVMTVAQILTYA